MCASWVADQESGVEGCVCVSRFQSVGSQVIPAPSTHKHKLKEGHTCPDGANR